MAQVLAKEYECHTCKRVIRISKIENVPARQRRKWDRFELDGVTPHVCKPKREQQKQQPQPQPIPLSEGPQIAALAHEVSELRAEVKILIAQVQGLRAEIKNNKNNKKELGA
jgi:hypothetical protein